MTTLPKDAASAAPGQVVEVTDETFLAEVIEAAQPVLVDFWAAWCGPCRFMGPIFTQLAPEYAGRVKFAKLDVDANFGVANALQVRSIPTFALFSGNTVVAVGAGAMPEEAMRQWIERALERVPSSAPAESTS